MGVVGIGVACLLSMYPAQGLSHSTEEEEEVEKEEKNEEEERKVGNRKRRGNAIILKRHQEMSKQPCPIGTTTWLLGRTGLVLGTKATCEHVS